MCVCVCLILGEEARLLDIDGNREGRPWVGHRRALPSWLYVWRSDGTSHMGVTQGLAEEGQRQVTLKLCRPLSTCLDLCKPKQVSILYL